MREKEVNLTAAEIGCLWTSYMNDSLSACMLEIMMRHLEDTDIKPVVKQLYDTSIDHLEKLRTIFDKEKFVVPNGFNEQDINPNAPRLFTDIFCLSYVNNMAKIGMVTYSGYLAMSLRKDIRAYFIKSLTTMAEVYDKSSEIALKKGINAKPPTIETPKEIDYVDTKKYMSGLNPFQDNRPLNAVEISHLYSNVTTNTIGSKLSLAFAQTSPEKDVQEFMLRSKEISEKHIKVFVSTLMKDDILTSQTPDVSISNSTTQTFSDKLMMYHMSIISAAGIGNYATAGAASQRSDLAINYERLSLEVARLAKSGADIMIKHHWLEQPPGTMSREKLAKDKN